MKNRQIKCPQCGLLTFYTTENPFRPFCSERCKLIDLGDWASERYKVPTSENSPDSHWNEIAESDQNDDQNGEF